MESCYSTDIWPADESLVILQHFLDAFIAATYSVVPLELIYFIRISPIFPHKWVFVHFGTFTVLCGATYLTNLWKYSNYSTTAALVIMLVKVLAALVSWLIVFILIYVIPNLSSQRKRETSLKNKAADLGKEMGLIIRDEETGRSVTKLTNQILSTLDGQIIAKTTVVELGRTLGLEECALWFPSQTNKSLRLTHSLNH